MVFKGITFNTTHTSLYDRVSKLLESFEWSDCSFSVLGKHFKAHKLILGISSPVFQAMLYGPMANNNEIDITDIEPDIFQLLINYIYTDKVEITSIEQAYELLYAAKKYLLEYLKQRCVDYITENLSIDNVVAVLNFSEYIQEEKLTESCLKLMREHAEFILSENLEKISCASMKLILASENINCSEKNLINFIFEWTYFICKANDLPVTIENRRRVLISNGLLPMLRFSCLNEHEFQEILNDKCDHLLLDKEIKEIQNNIINRHQTKDDNDSNTNLAQIVTHKKPRTLLSISWLMCYRRKLRSGPPLLIDHNNSSVNLRLKSDKSIFVKSLCVPTRMSPSVNFHYNKNTMYSEQFSVTITHESDKAVIKYINFMNTVEYDTNVSVEFPETCLLKKDEWYNICFTWPQPRSGTCKYIIGHRESECQNIVKFQFQDVNNEGSFLEGLKFA